MAEQAQTQKSFLDKVVEQSDLETTNQAQAAANAVFRILRDMLSRRSISQVEQDLRTQAPESEQDVVDLWQDVNVMVGFFSRISPVQNLHLKPGTFMLRLKEEGYLPESVPPENVARAVFSATKDILPPERIQEVAEALPGEIRQIWEQA